MSRLHSFSERSNAIPIVNDVGSPDLSPGSPAGALRLAGSGRRNLGRRVAGRRSVRDVGPVHRFNVEAERRESRQGEGLRARPRSGEASGVVALRRAGGNIAVVAVLGRLAQRNHRSIRARSRRCSVACRRLARGQAADGARAQVSPVHNHPLAMAAMLDGARARGESCDAREGDDQERRRDPARDESGEASDHPLPLCTGANARTRPCG